MEGGTLKNWSLNKFKMAIISMPDIWQIVTDSWTTTIKENVRFQGGICL